MGGEGTSFTCFFFFFLFFYLFFFFFFNDTATTEIYTLSLHDALPILEELRAALEKSDFRIPKIPIVPNVTAQATSDPQEIRLQLVRQLTRPVRWVESVRAMIAKGTVRFYEVGAGRVLTGLIKRIDRRVPCTPVGTLQDLEKAVLP